MASSRTVPKAVLRWIRVYAQSERQLLASFLGRSAASELVICHVGTVEHAPAE